MSEVFVNRRRVGTLSRGEPTHRFAYEVGVPESLAVSLLMPVAGSSYPAERLTVLHPVFDMNLPEGALREALNQLFAKALLIHWVKSPSQKLPHGFVMHMHSLPS